MTAGAQRVREHHSAQSMAQAYLELYRDLLEKAHVRRAG